MITGACILILILTLFTFPISLGAKVEMDLAKNEGEFAVRVLGLEVIHDKLYFEHVKTLENDLIVQSKKKKKFFHLNTDKEDKRSIRRIFDIDFVPYVNVKSVDVHFALGKSDDALFTTFAVGVVKVIVFSLLARLKSHESVEITQSFTPEYNLDSIKLHARIKADVTVGDLIYSFISYINKKIKEERKNDYSARRTSY